jgi:hypothetical protein
MVISSSDIHWEDVKIHSWNNKNRSLPSSIAKVYEDTKIGHEKRYELQPAIAETLYIQCLPDCKSCNGYIVIANSGRSYKCSCIHHTLLDSDYSSEI